MIEIERFLVVAEAILGIDANQLKDRHKDWLRNFYKHPIQRAAVLASRIIRNHALPDGNKRVALLMMDDYLEENGWPYRRSHCRHDLHWLVRVQSHACASYRDRTHSLTGLRACNRRPHQG